MMQSFDLTLGGVTFQSFEVPDRIAFGGDQMTSVHKLVGGQRVIDALGRDDVPLDWTGRFTGPDAFDRAQALNTMRIAGQAVELAWHRLRFSVVVKRFVAEFEKPFLIPYTISCEIAEDLASPLGQDTDDSLDDQVSSDFDDASDYGDAIGDDDLTGYLGQVGTALQSAGSLVAATRSTLNTVIGPLQAAQAQVAMLQGLADAQLGGVLAGAPSDLAASLLGQSAALAQLDPLNGAAAALGRMGTNLQDVETAGSRVLSSGGDLYRIAAEQYGDSSQWPIIAKASGLTDPLLSGLNTITTPPSQAPVDGVLLP